MAVNLAKLFLVRSPVWMVPSLICAEVIWPAATDAPVPAMAATAATAATVPTLPRALLLTQLLSFMVPPLARCALTSLTGPLAEGWVLGGL